MRRFHLTVEATGFVGSRQPRPTWVPPLGGSTSSGWKHLQRVEAPPAGGSTSSSPCKLRGRGSRGPFQRYWARMRIVAGEFRGRTIKAPTWEGLRPTSDRLRETLFNILGPGIRGARVLDGFAGTGAIGIEALSRGAAAVAFVERDPRAIALIEANLAPLVTGERPKPVIIRAGFAEAAARLSERVFDVIVLDPPYAETAAADALGAAQP